MNTGLAGRNLRLDALKLLCAQCIVWHHFSSYGPLARAFEQAAPALWGWLFDYGRMAVQVFLVLGGYLAAASLQRLALAGAKGGTLRWRQLVWRRYLRLVGPLLAALLLVSGAAALAGSWLAEDWVPGAPTWAQLASHVVLLQDLLGIEALSVGVWYVAIDFQLYALLAALFGLGARWRPVPWLRTCSALSGQRIILLGVAGLTAMSLFYANLQPGWDVAALYFFGAYGMGVLAWLAQTSPQRHRVLWWVGCGVSLAVGMASVLLFRERLVLAWLTFLVVLLQPVRQQGQPDAPNKMTSVSPPPLLGEGRGGGCLQQTGANSCPHPNPLPEGEGISSHLIEWSPARPLQHWVGRLGGSSYGLFLTHFAVLLLSNAVVAQWGALGAAATWAVLLASVLLCTALGLWFTHQVERRWSAWLGR
ncbi:acyltransferase family protein [Rhodoferax sp.]|uniref:acyltransferase family protein n=1 Tax=Rhodoferax sp. TaxID=50421 RepID=UPI0026072EAE|nr:acyltransferase family protein [Rhodoferax sp.]MDD5480406.1 acyltransferase family protein [Rhodoferax sp.]